MGSRHEGDLYVTGTLGVGTLVPSAGSVINTHIGTGGSGANVAYTKLQQMKSITGSQPNTTATTETRHIYTAYGATGSIVAFKAGSIAIATGAATVTFDLKKNGTSVLTGVLTLNTSSVARVMQPATVSSASFVAGDWFEIVITATAGGGTLQTGVGYELVVSEDPS